MWNGERVAVTSFKDSNKAVIACSYTDDGGFSQSTCQNCGETKTTWPKEEARRADTHSLHEDSEDTEVQNSFGFG